MNSEIDQYANNGSRNLNADRDLHVQQIFISENVARLFAKELPGVDVPQLVTRGLEKRHERSLNFFGKFCNMLKGKNAVSDAKFEDPGIQASIEDAVTGFTRSGDEAVGDVLADLLAERVTCERRDTKDLSLDLAIQAAGKMDSEHYNALSLLLLLLNSTFSTSGGLAGLFHHFRELLIPFGESLDISETDVRYLEDLGCLKANSGFTFQSFTFAHGIRTIYQGMFTKGTDPNDHIASTLSSVQILRPGSPFPLLVPCPRSPGMVQVNAMTNKDLEALKKEISHLDQNQQTFVATLNESKSLSDEEILAELTSFDSRFKNLAQAWDSTTLGRTNITVTGTVIAHSNLRRVLGEKFLTPLDVWLPTRTAFKGA